MRRWKGQESELRELPQDTLQSQMRLRQKGVGNFQQLKRIFLKKLKHVGLRESLGLKLG